MSSRNFEFQFTPKSDTFSFQNDDMNNQCNYCTHYFLYLPYSTTYSHNGVLKKIPNPGGMRTPEANFYSPLASQPEISIERYTYIAHIQPGELVLQSSRKTHDNFINLRSFVNQLIEMKRQLLHTDQHSLHHIAYTCYNLFIDSVNKSIYF